jgi:hypothetical protein
MPKPDFVDDRAWSVPVLIHEVPDTGRHFDLVADDRICSAIATAADLRGVSRLEAAFDVARLGRDGLHVVGRVRAHVVQTCVVTLEPIEADVDEVVDLKFSAQLDDREPEFREAGAAIDVDLEDATEPLVGDRIDLGDIATECLILGVDPYPRKPGAVFELPSIAEQSSHPFAALSALKKQPDGE